VEAHILVALLAYGLLVTLKQRLQAHAPGLTPRAVLDKLAAIQKTEAEAAVAAATPDQGTGARRRGGRVGNVVQTQGVGLLKTKDLVPPGAKIRLV